MFHKILSRMAGELAVKTHTQHGIHPGVGQIAALIPQARQAGWRILRREHLQRLGLKDHHHHRHPKTIALLTQTRQQRPMPPVHAVKVADGQHTATMPRA